MTTKINKVVLSGFKSFRKKTVIPFFDGMTAVIGENGSGKSNLFDAVSFVMGRRSSQLRADRLEHLIFNGGNERAPAEQAEVILSLDNASGVFNPFLDNGNLAPEVTLGRRITRRSSTYTFMGKTCKRELIDQVLEAARIDPDGQQLIAQGSITDVIRRNPVRRREILDEVSGIASYDEKKKKAIAELKDVKSKLNTHRVILAERRRRLLALSQERDAALEYQRLTEEQERLTESIHYRQRVIIEEKLARAKQERVGMDERIKEAEDAVEKLDLDIENKEWEIEGLREELKTDGQISLVKEVERLRAEILHRQGEINFKQQQVKNLEEMIEEVARIKAAEKARVQQQTPALTNRAIEALLERKRGGIYGTVASLAAPRPVFEVAF
jgi:chromosome segregation protein